MSTSECATGDFHAVWAAALAAPVSSDRDDSGAAVVWGDPISPATVGRVDARQVRKVWCRELGSAPVWDGFFAAAAFEVGIGLVAGADQLGLFPIYFYATDDLLLVGSSPQLFRHHEGFRQRLNPAGLVAILLTAGVGGHETLWQEVRRLGPGQLLTWKPGGKAGLVSQAVIQASDRYFHLPFSTHVEILGDAMREAVRRHTASAETHGLLLSGGRDSRLLAGLLHDVGVSPASLTLGLPHDADVVCARRVTRHLRARHLVVQDRTEDYERFAELQVRWEHLAGGVSSLYTWGIIEPLRGLSSRVVTGHLIDSTLGVTFLKPDHAEPANRDAPLTDFRAQLLRFGVGAPSLERLLRPEIFGDAVPDGLSRFASQCEGYPGISSQRAWWCILLTHERFHAGATPWRLAFGAWPVLPILDQHLLATLTGMPPASLAAHRAQDELLRSRYPGLARLPLDRGGSTLEPLTPTLWHRTRQRVHRWVPSWREQRAPRRYPRLYDINSPGWRAVRERAEVHRRRMKDLFVPEVLDELLPDPRVTIAVRNPIIDTTGTKLLIGLLLWAGENL